MKPFLDEDFLLDTKCAGILYHGYAQEEPIFDFSWSFPITFSHFPVGKETPNAPLHEKELNIRKRTEYL